MRHVGGGLHLGQHILLLLAKGLQNFDLLAVPGLVDVGLVLGSVEPPAERLGL